MALQQQAGGMKNVLIVVHDQDAALDGRMGGLGGQSECPLSNRCPLYLYASGQ
jgi:hypothetical protein